MPDARCPIPDADRHRSRSRELFYTRRGVGKPTRLAPIPKPAPVLAETAKLGTYVSKMLKVAAAVKAINATSSKERPRLGMAYAAIATITPSTKYLMVLLTSSPKSKTPAVIENIIIINNRKKIIIDYSIIPALFAFKTLKTTIL